jgi:hypothetical protein
MVATLRCGGHFTGGVLTYIGGPMPSRPTLITGAVIVRRPLGRNPVFNKLTSKQEPKSHIR